MQQSLNLNYFRRFGVEIELNSFDGRNKPLGFEVGNLPEGINYVANLVNKITNERVLIHKWSHDHDNSSWILKPDSSCGMEVCTPVYKGWSDLLKVCKVIDSFKEDKNIKADSRCSVHVHVDVSDLSMVEISSILSWWIKSEAIFMDAMPIDRKFSQYCQFIGLSTVIDNIENTPYSCDAIFNLLGESKYYSLNTYHYKRNKRKTIEFRIMDNEACLNAWSVKNWVRLILHFIQSVIKIDPPVKYDFKNKWAGYSWLDPSDLFYILGFLPNQYELSPGIQQVRSWFLQRLKMYTIYDKIEGIISKEARSFAYNDVCDLYSRINIEDFVSKDQIYCDKFRI